jgi:hypothetical protein
MPSEIWKHSDTMRGDEWIWKEWLVLRRRGDDIYNVFRNGELLAMAFRDSILARHYAEFWDKKNVR